MDERKDARGMTEAEAIARYRSRSYPKPALTADIAVFCRKKDHLSLLLIRRGNHPCFGRWALPGGFANENEAIEQTAARELQEETGVSGLALQLAGIYSRPGRDPRGWVVSAAFCAVLDNQLPSRAGDDAAEAIWFTVDKDARGLFLSGAGEKLRPQDLAFDHGEIVRDALSVLGRKA